MIFMIFIASDHAGFFLKNDLLEYLNKKGYDVRNLGPKKFNKNDDYPIYCSSLARAVKKNKLNFGIIIGGSGEGEAIAVNRFKGLRAAVYYGGPVSIVNVARKHNNANVLSLGARFISKKEAFKAVINFLKTPFPDEARHKRRIRMLDRLK